MKSDSASSLYTPYPSFLTHICNMAVAEKKRLDVMQMRCLRSMCGVTHMDQVRNEEVQRRTGVMIELVGQAEQSVLRWFGHMERMEED